VTQSWPHYADGQAIQQQGKQTPSPQTEGSISRSTLARFNDSVNGSSKWQGAATLRRCAVIQTMVPVCRKIQKLQDDQLDERDLYQDP